VSVLGMTLGNTARLGRHGTAVWSWRDNSVGAEVNFGGTPTSWSCLSLRLNSAASMDGYLNGGSATNFDPNDDVDDGTAFAVGARGDGTQKFWNGDVAEVLVYNSALSGTDLDKVRGYLSDKYPTLGAFGTAPADDVTVAGDVPALGRLVVTEADGDDQWTVFYGLQSRYYSADAEAALFFQAEDLTPVGTSTDTAGAAGASGTNVIRNTDLIPTWQAILRSEIDTSNAALEHKGDFRVFARLYRPTGNTGAVSVRLEWGLGDYRNPTQNDAVQFAAGNHQGLFTLVDLGTVHIDPESERWEFRLLAKSTVVGDELDADCFLIVPTTEGYGEPSGLLRTETPSTFSGRSAFTTESGAITGDSAATGGAWVGAGDADDFSVAGGAATRTAVSDTTNIGRYITLNLNLTDTVVQVDSDESALGIAERGLIARYADANNWLIATVRSSGLAGSTPILAVEKRVGGTITELIPTTFLSAALVPSLLTTTIRLAALADGTWAVWVAPQGQRLTMVAAGKDSALATGGTLATGDPGIYDEQASAVANTRTYTNWFAFVPVRDAAMFASQSLEVSHDRMRREDSTGTYYERVSVPGGRYLKIPPAGPEARSARLLVKAVRGPEVQHRVWVDDGIDDISATLYATPRGLVVPEG
jgi:hypothetical protein